MSTQNSDIIRYLLFRLRKEARKESRLYQELFLGLKRELQISSEIDLRPSNRRSWLKVREYLDDNDMLVLVKAFLELDLPTLTHLDLSNNWFGEQGAIAVVESLRQVYLPSLTYLDLSHIKLGEKGVVALAEILKTGYLPGLVWLDISQSLDFENGNGEKESNSLAGALMSGNLSQLEHLGLPPCNLDRVVNALWVGRIKYLSYLHLSGPWEGGSNGRLASIGELLRIINDFPLEHIHLRRCGLAWDVMEQFTLALVSRGESHQYVKHLDLSENNLGVRGVVALGKAMKEGHLSSIHHLSLGLCGIEEIYQIRALEEGIRSGNMSNLTYLDLSSNNFGFIGTCALVNLIEEGRFPNLLHLNISDCNMRKVDGLETLRPGRPLRTRSYLESDERDVFDFISSMSKGFLSQLQVLDMSFNKLKTQGCISLANVIKDGNLRDLRQLQLCGCGIKDKGIVSLVEAMDGGQLFNLESFDLGFNKFDKVGVEAIATSLKDGLLPKLKYLNLYLLRRQYVPFRREDVAPTYETIYAVGGEEVRRSPTKDKDAIVRLSFFWAQEKRAARLVKRESYIDDMVRAIVDAFLKNHKLTTNVVGFGDHDTMIQELRDKNLHVRVHNQLSEDDTPITIRTLALTMVIFSLGFYLYFL